MKNVSERNMRKYLTPCDELRRPFTLESSAKHRSRVGVEVENEAWSAKDRVDESCASKGMRERNLQDSLKKPASSFGDNTSITVRCGVMRQKRDFLSRKKFTEVLQESLRDDRPFFVALAEIEVAGRKEHIFTEGRKVFTAMFDREEEEEAVMLSSALGPVAMKDPEFFCCTSDEMKFSCIGHFSDIFREGIGGPLAQIMFEDSSKCTPLSKGENLIAVAAVFSRGVRVKRDLEYARKIANKIPLGLRQEILGENLLVAASMTSAWYVDFLLEEGADPNFFSKDGEERALPSALHNERLENAKILLKWGADPELGSYIGSAVDVAARSCNSDIREIFDAHRDRNAQIFGRGTRR